MEISILGGGSWGSALAVHLAKKDHNVFVWEFFEAQAHEMQQKRACKLLPSVRLPENIFISSKIDDVFAQGCDIVLLVVPSDKIENTIEMAKKYLTGQSIVICSKGFAKGLRLLSEIVAEKVQGEVYCLYGPTHAEEVGQGMFSGIVLAGGTGKEKLQAAFESNFLKVDLSDDIIGVQVCAALKNILAVFVGVLDGMNLGDNAKAFVMTKGLEEIKEIGMAWGAQEKTFLGLAGMGDVIVTCTSTHSRNRFVGQEIGKGKPLEEILKGMAMVAEGVTTTKFIPQLQQRFSLKLPLFQGLYDILFTGKKPEQVLKAL